MTKLNMERLITIEKPINFDNGVNSSHSRILPLFIGILILGLIATTLYFYFETKSLRENNQKTSIKRSENSDLKENLKTHILLPDEEPTIATINNINVLKQENPEFYKNGENGDILFIYTQKAILYDKDQDKILNIAPIVTGTFLTPTATTTITPTKKK
jgi:hypothetical protein